jgi:hypothetical protein
VKTKPLAINVGLTLALAALLITGIALAVPGVAQATLASPNTISNNLTESYDIYTDSYNPGPVWLAAKFGAGATPFNYQIDSATLSLTKFTDDPYVAQAAIFSDIGGLPGTQIGGNLVQIGTIPVIADGSNPPLASDFANVKFSASASAIGNLISTNTYWVVLKAIGDTPNNTYTDQGFGWAATTSTGGTGWGRLPSLFITVDGGDSWFDLSGAGSYKMDVQATPVPASVLLLGTGLIGLVGYRRMFKKS